MLDFLKVFFKGDVADLAEDRQSLMDSDSESKS